jgi:SAM-dependent methyltransferase/FKBP-type peptidyl-prolyl cis-trans isomerase 2
MTEPATAAAEVTAETWSERVLAKVRFTLEWQSEGARHTDIRAAEKVNAWRDILPMKLDAALQGKHAGERAGCELRAGELNGAAYDPSLVKTIPASGIDTGLFPQLHVAADFGRFYPQGVIHPVGHLYGIFKQNLRPLRVLERVGEDRLKVDLNHPFARYPARLSADIEAMQLNEGEAGGRCVDWGFELTEGPGMQARCEGKPSEFCYEGALERIDESADAVFYSVPRMVVHLDSTALKVIEDLHRRFVGNGMKVLDLMSSMRSHLADDIAPAEVVGLGLNAAELAANPRLTSHLVQDLNATPRLPFDDAAFDVALCTSSVEYLLDPARVAAEVARVLRPGAPFVLTFSHRWFPPKVIRLWRELHPFERMGYVLEALHRSQGFSDLETWTLRGLPRPADDRHSSPDGFSDPVFAVWGRRKA